MEAFHWGIPRGRVPLAEAWRQSLQPVNHPAGINEEVNPIHISSNFYGDGNKCRLDYSPGFLDFIFYSSLQASCQTGKADRSGGYGVGILGAPGPWHIAPCFHFWRNSNANHPPFTSIYGQQADEELSLFCKP